MKIALVGATGHIGRQIARQALARGHHVTAIVRQDTHLPDELKGAHIKIASLDEPTALALAIEDCDVLASAFGSTTMPEQQIGVTRTLIDAAHQAGIKRLIVVGGAGSLEVASGTQLIDTPDFPEAYKPVSSAHRQAFNVLREVQDLDWTCLAPAAEIGPGEERGHYRVQANRLLTDAEGHSKIHYADYASAFVNEIEHPQFVRQIATVAY